MPATPPPALSRHSLWPDNFKLDRRAEASKQTKEGHVEISYKPEVAKTKEEPRLYPVFMPSPVTSSSSDFSSIDAPTPLTDLTTRPGEVQADYLLDLPYNGFRFQSPTPVVSTWRVRGSVSGAIQCCSFHLFVRGSGYVSAEACSCLQLD